PGYGIYECADGHVMFMVGIAGFGAGWPVLINWMQEEGAAEDLADPKYLELFENLDMRTLTNLLMGGGDPQTVQEMMQRFAHINEVLTAFIKGRSKQYLYEEGQARRLLVGIVSTPKDLYENPQLRAHDFWAEVEHPELGPTFEYPGAPYHIPKAPWRIRRRAPLLGEHTRSVLCEELGLTDEDIVTLSAAGIT
ncbi:MAG TPA: CoA transferase, partial [Dehalococcoidia bacterium]|nr:CoA transferase [Dehalococcoidia bacterium]